jgi:hypothetical protein
MTLIEQMDKSHENLSSLGLTSEVVDGDVKACRLKE